MFLKEESVKLISCIFLKKISLLHSNFLKKFSLFHFGGFLTVTSWGFVIGRRTTGAPSLFLLLCVCASAPFVFRYRFNHHDLASKVQKNTVRKALCSSLEDHLAHSFFLVF